MTGGGSRASAFSHSPRRIIPRISVEDTGKQGAEGRTALNSFSVSSSAQYRLNSSRETGSSPRG